jgi:hypothetical protein
MDIPTVFLTPGGRNKMKEGPSLGTVKTFLAQGWRCAGQWKESRRRGGF